jgi:hypothetical protein
LDAAVKQFAGAMLSFKFVAAPGPCTSKRRFYEHAILDHLTEQARRLNTLGLALAPLQSRWLEALNKVVKRKARDLPGGGHEVGSEESYTADSLFLLFRNLIEHNFVKRRRHFSEVAARRTQQAATQTVRMVERDHAAAAELEETADHELLSG